MQLSFKFGWGMQRKHTYQLGSSEFSTEAGIGHDMTGFLIKQKITTPTQHRRKRGLFYIPTSAISRDKGAL